MRIGITLNEGRGPQALDRLTDEIRQAADDGFASAWLPNIFGFDAMTALAVAGSRVPGIELGTAVVPTYPRHPAALAQQARTTALAIGDGRFTLGIGLSHQVVIENMFGLDFDRPVRHMREYLAILGPLLERQPVSFTGETMRANIALSTPGEGPIPILLAALGPQMLKLAGQHTAGTILWMTGAKTIASHIAPVINEAARAAGAPAPRIICNLPVCITDDPEPARAQAAENFAMYNTLPSYRAMMDREGAEGAADLAIIGTEEEVAARLADVEAAGATEFGAIVYMRGDTRTRKFLSQLAQS
ncbi:LLM class F420-dependent oxidoreductase [Nocardia bovistercoris]|uniref:LLM class F420-dependent oxidoreductase n=1 Tax=Nocardia bovistercoris TaxID=2785916 RepID=A0A931N291_9NOCA|nr:LLM class F420-dependent oxidoreductase [Nocardia bovistercoris]MBH0775791.1 LLM class F420-dependent oxidoreductase [Nocardia bovistercoris]